MALQYHRLRYDQNPKRQEIGSRDSIYRHGIMRLRRMMPSLFGFIHLNKLKYTVTIHLERLYFLERNPMRNKPS